MTDDAFLTAFERCELTRADWTHAAHVRVGWLYLATGDPFDCVLARVRQAIQRFNLAVLNKPEGYHETITHAFLRLIAARRVADGMDQDFASFRSKHADLFSSNVLGRHYRKATIDSPEARRQFVLPDLEPLPEVEAATNSAGSSNSGKLAS